MNRNNLSDQELMTTNAEERNNSERRPCRADCPAVTRGRRVVPVHGQGLFG